jgi:hypothetical protein
MDFVVEAAEAGEVMPVSAGLGHLCELGVE